MRELAIEKNQEFLDLLSKIKDVHMNTVDAIVYFESDLYAFFYLIVSEKDRALKALGYEVVTWEEFDSKQLHNNKLPWLMKGELMYERDALVKYRIEDLKFNAIQRSRDNYLQSGKHYLYQAKSLYFDMYQDYQDYVSDILINLLHAVACLNYTEYDEMTSIVSQVKGYDRKPLDFFNRLEEISQLNYVVVHRLLELLIIDINNIFKEIEDEKEHNNDKICSEFYKLKMASRKKDYLSVYFFSTKLVKLIKDELGELINFYELPNLNLVLRSRDYVSIESAVTKYFELYKSKKGIDKCIESKSSWSVS